VATALGHGVMPLLHAGLSAGATDAVPDATRLELRQHYLANAAHNLARASELLHLLALFDLHGIQAVPLKGPVLATSAYGNLGMRQFADLDVLIPKQAAATVERLLGARGFHMKTWGETSSISAVREDEPSPTAVDLHWALAEDRYSFPLTGDELRSRLTQVPFLNSMVWQPPPDDQLLFLCSHPAKHCWSRLEWVTDIAAFVQSHRRRIDWGYSLDRASRLGARRLLLLGVRLAHDLVSLPVPDELTGPMDADREVARLASELGARLRESSHLHRLNGSYGPVDAGLLYMRTRERLSDKMPYSRFLLRLFRQRLSVVPNEQDRAAIALPPALDALYFAVRPVRLLRKYGRRMARWSLQAGRVLLEKPL
jgi:hypothetical protein